MARLVRATVGVALVVGTALSGGGEPAQAGPSAGPLVLSTSSVDFGGHSIGSQSGYVAVQITNSGSTAYGPLSIIGGAAEAPFDNFQTCQGVTLDPGESCRMEYRFSPSALGEQTATSSFSLQLSGDGSTNQPFAVALRGVGVQPITVSTSSVDFGGHSIGSQSGYVAVQITNSGSTAYGPLSIIGGAAEAPFDNFQTCQGVTLDPGESCRMEYRFSPSALGEQTATSSFSIQRSGFPASNVNFPIELRGVGVQPLVVTPLDIDFGVVAVGDTSPQIQAVVTNSGSSPYGPINMTGGGAEEPFDNFQSCQGVTLAPGATCAITYWFSPPSPGPHAATVPFSLARQGYPSSVESFPVTLFGCGDAACDRPTTSSSSSSSSSSSVSPSDSSSSSSSSSSSVSPSDSSSSSSVSPSDSGSSSSVSPSDPTTTVAGVDAQLPATGTGVSGATWAAVVLLAGCALVLAGRLRADSGR